MWPFKYWSVNTLYSGVLDPYVFWNVTPSTLVDVQNVGYKNEGVTTDNATTSMNEFEINWVTRGPDSSVGIATRYGLDGPGIESRWGRNFPHPSRPARTSTQPPTQWVPGLLREQSGRDVALTTHAHLASMLKKEYSYRSSPPLGLRGLF